MLSNLPNIKLMSLSHGLGDEDLYGTGYTVLLWIEETVHSNSTYQPPRVEIHAENPVAAQKMRALHSVIQRELKRTNRKNF